MTLLPIIAKGLESVESIGDVLCANDIEDNCRKKKVVDLKGEITFQDVSFTYKGNEKPVLSHLNFKIQPGETVAFAGGSGSGKTTILNLAIGFLKADSGQVLVDGNDLIHNSPFSSPELSARISPMDLNLSPRNSYGMSYVQPTWKKLSRNCLMVWTR